MSPSGSSGLSIEEFDTFMRRKLKTQAYERKCIEKDFSKYDLNKDGYVTMEELREARVRAGKPPMTAEQEQEWLAADTNGDGKIDFDGESFFLDSIDLSVYSMFYIDTHLK